MSAEKKGGMTHCSKCGDHIDVMAARGSYLKRTSPKGQMFVGECAPSCKSVGDQDNAILRAIGVKERRT